MTENTSPRTAIRDAAALILIDGSDPENPRFLLGKRHKNQIFLPGQYVFPGGRVERDDGRMNVFGTLADPDEEALLTRLPRPSHTRARAMALAAIRECAEETGLYLGTRDLGAPEKAPALWHPFQERGIYPALDGLHFVARAITPPGHPRRYDTRFFAATTDLVTHRQKGIVNKDAELVKLVWVTVEESRDVMMLDITRHILQDAHRRFITGLDRLAPIPFYFSKSGKRIRTEL